MMAGTAAARSALMSDGGAPLLLMGTRVQGVQSISVDTPANPMATATALRRMIGRGGSSVDGIIGGERRGSVHRKVGWRESGERFLNG